jgi:hypothetical protein
VTIVHLEHVNVQIPDQRIATLFYVSGLGLTRDPYLMTSTNNMWINIGRSQFHLPTGKPQLLRGHVALVIVQRDSLLRRLAAVQPQLADTQFAFAERDDHVEAVSPWGNVIRCFEPDPRRFGPIRLGMPYVQFDVPRGTAAPIARFYREMLDVAAEATNGVAHVPVGTRQQLVFSETERAAPPYDGHHVQVYVSDYAESRARLERHGLVSEDNGPHQYRFVALVDLDTRQPLFTIEHEVRSTAHPLYQRPLVNRNPDQTNMNYRPGEDALDWKIETIDAD